MTEVVVSSPAAVLTALVDPALVPHRTTDTSTGSSMRLRAAMARFSDPTVHPPRRAAVIAAIDRIDPDTVRRVAAELTAERLVGDEVDVLQEIGRVVPTLALCDGMGLTAAVSSARRVGSCRGRARRNRRQRRDTNEGCRAAAGRVGDGGR